RAGHAVVDAQLVAERQVEAGVQALPQQVGGQLLVARQPHPGQAELPFLVVPVRVEERRLAHQELRLVVNPQLGKWALPTMTRTSGSARVSVARNASILATHSSAKGGRSAPVEVLAR